MPSVVSRRTGAASMAREQARSGVPCNTAEPVSMMRKGSTAALMTTG